MTQKAAKRRSGLAKGGVPCGNILCQSFLTGETGKAKIPITRPRKPVTEKRPYTGSTQRQNKAKIQDQIDSRIRMAIGRLLSVRIFSIVPQKVDSVKFL